MTKDEVTNFFVISFFVVSLGLCGWLDVVAAVGAEAEAEAQEGLLDEVALGDEGAEMGGAVAELVVGFGGHLGEDVGEVREAVDGDACVEVVDNVADGCMFPDYDRDAAAQIKRCFMWRVDAEVFAGKTIAGVDAVAIPNEAEVG